MGQHKQQQTPRCEYNTRWCRDSAPPWHPRQRTWSLAATSRVSTHDNTSTRALPLLATSSSVRNPTPGWPYEYPASMARGVGEPQDAPVVARVPTMAVPPTTSHGTGRSGGYTADDDPAVRRGVEIRSQHRSIAPRCAPGVSTAAECLKLRSAWSGTCHTRSRLLGRPSSAFYNARRDLATARGSSCHTLCPYSVPVPLGNLLMRKSGLCHNAVWTAICLQHCRQLCWLWSRVKHHHMSCQQFRGEKLGN